MVDASFPSPDTWLRRWLADCISIARESLSFQYASLTAEQRSEVAAEVAFFERLLAKVDGEDRLTDTRAMPPVTSELVDDVVRWLGRAVSDADEWSAVLRNRGEHRRAAYIDAGTASYRQLIDSVRAWPQKERE